MKLRFATFLTSALFIVRPMAADQPAFTVEVELKASAPLQLAYAKKLMQEIHVAHTSRDRHIAVANATFNLMAVEHKWPNDRAAVNEAKACLAVAYVEGEMPRNALEAAEAGLRDIHGDHRLHYARGWALERFGNGAEAAAEYERVVNTFDWKNGGRMENGRMCTRVTYFFEQAKRHDLAVIILRKRIEEPGLTPTSRVNVAMQVIDQLQISGSPIQKKDIETLRGAYNMSLAMTLLPAQRAMVTRAEERLRELDAAQH